MKIKCITNKIASLPDEIRKNYITSDEEFSLKERNEYIVYALTTGLEGIWYCICDEHYSYYPRWYYSKLFEIIDGRLSRYWIFSIDEIKGKQQVIFSFPEWANDSYFYADLVDGYEEDQNVTIFITYVKLMYFEFPDPSISDIAQVGDSEWLICPICIDAWETSNSIDAMVKCPKCNKVMHNPRYETSARISK